MGETSCDLLFKTRAEGGGLVELGLETIGSIGGYHVRIVIILGYWVDWNKIYI